MIKGIAAGFAALIALLALTWIFQGNSFFLYQYFAPKEAQVERQTFEQTKSYRQGMVQELQNMQFEYVKADNAHKAALADIILHRAADVPSDAMPSDLASFVAELKRDRVNPAK